MKFWLVMTAAQGRICIRFVEGNFRWFFPKVPDDFLCLKQSDLKITTGWCNSVGNLKGMKQEPTTEEACEVFLICHKDVFKKCGLKLRIFPGEKNCSSVVEVQH